MTKKQTSDRISRIAAQLMNMCEGGNVVVRSLRVDPDADPEDFITYRVVENDITALVESVAASALSQDEARGPTKGKRKRARK